MSQKWPALKTESEDFLHLDVLRFAAAMGVVAFHWRVWLQLDPTAARLALGLDNWASFVDLFFVISGFIICHAYATRMDGISAFFDFLRKRVARLIPLHWLTLAFFAVAGLVAKWCHYELTNPEDYNFDCFVPNALLLHGFGFCQTESFNGPSWSISAEMGCYLLFPAVLALYRVNVWLPGIAGAIGIALLSGLGAFGPEHEQWYNFTYYWSILRALPEFAIGVTLYGIRNRLRIPHAGLCMYLALAFMIALGQFGASQFWTLALVYLIAVLGAAADSTGQSGAMTRRLAPLGVLTYSIYMLHMPVGTVLISAGAGELLGLPPLWVNVATFAAIPALLAISYASYVMFETPARRALSGRAKKRAQPAAHRAFEAP